MISYTTVSHTTISNLNVKLLHEESKYNDCRMKELLGTLLTSFNEKMLNPFKSYYYLSFPSKCNTFSC